jgi:hypothetical protein
MQFKKSLDIFSLFKNSERHIIFFINAKSIHLKIQKLTYWTHSGWYNYSCIQYLVMIAHMIGE